MEGLVATAKILNETENGLGNTKNNGKKGSLELIRDKLGIVCGTFLCMCSRDNEAVLISLSDGRSIIMIIDDILLRQPLIQVPRNVDRFGHIQTA